MYLRDTITVDAKGGRRTRDGYLVATARVARAGLQEYLGRELGRPELGKVVVYRPPEEVFATDAMRSYAHRPVTRGHPAHLVTAKTWASDKAAGHTEGDVVRDGDFVRVSMLLLDEEAAAMCQGGAEFSMGYEMEPDWTPGTTPDGTAYDAVQRKLRMNHVAIVDQARGGPDLVIDTTGGDRDMPGSLKTVTVDGIPVETTDAGATVIETLLRKMGVLATDHAAVITAKDREITTLTTAKNTAEGKVTALEQQVADAKVTPEALARMVADRKVVCDGFKALTGQIASDSATTADLMKAAVQKRLGDRTPATDEGIKAAFDALTHSPGAAPAAPTDPLRSAMSDGLSVHDGAINDTAVFAAAGVRMKKGA